MRGSVINGNNIALEPTFVLDARPSLPQSAGAYRVEGLDISVVEILFSYSFEPFVLDHAPNIRPFTIAVPSNSDLEERLASVVVRGLAPGQQLSAAPMPSAL